MSEGNHTMMSALDLRLTEEDLNDLYENAP